MPSLQQFNSNDSNCHQASLNTTTSPGAMRSPNNTITGLSADTTTLTAAAAAAAATVGTELLQQHSINSIIEQRRQDFLTRHASTTRDAANTTLTNSTNSTSDTLTSTLNDPIALTAEFLGLDNRSTNPTTATTMTNNILNLANVGNSTSTSSSSIIGKVCGAVGANGIGRMAAITGVGGGVNASSSTTSACNGTSLQTNIDVLNCNGNANALAAAYMPLTPSSTQSSISPGTTATGNTFDMFQFDNIAPSQQHQQQNTPLKVFQRNISFDCSAPLSPSTPTSLYNNSFQSSPLVSDSSNSSSANGLSLDSIPMVYQNGYNTNGLTSTRSTSPESQNSNQSNENNLIDMMKFLKVAANNQQNQLPQQQQQQQSLNIQQDANLQQQQQQRLKQQQQTEFLNTDFDSISNPTNLFDEQNLENFEALSAFDMELSKLQALNAVTLWQAQQQQMPLLQNLLQTYNTINQFQNWQLQQQQQQQQQPPAPPPQQQQQTVPPSIPQRLNNEQAAKFYRGSAAFCEPTCTWSGQLPPRSHRLYQFSPKVFLGGIPWDISEQSLIQIFRPFGQIKVEWPGKEEEGTQQPRGYVYIIFESDKQVKALLSACAVQADERQHGDGIFYFKISSRRIKAKDVEVIPWLIGDSNYVKSTSQKLDPTKTVFVGALHGKLTAEGLAKIMDDLFDGVLYAGIDTDKYKYPIGSGRVTFNNNRSYLKAISAAFVEIRTPKFTKKVQIDPYLEDSLCSICGVQHGPYYCRELSCFRYFCRSCWEWQHSTDLVKYHKPLSRNSKSQTLVGIGPATSTASIASNASTPSLPSINSRPVLNCRQTPQPVVGQTQAQESFNAIQQQQQQQQHHRRQQQQLQQTSQAGFQLQTQSSQSQQQQQQQQQQIPALNAFHF
ncbi:myb-like protein P isoform X2 [Musca domestica]|uniref:Myb-like protein P isoform X2 n=1 Tax=Musca domestica TaxID=7370 RepID=A0ABM3VB79_MUSDO|nr:myb-like protein P isoform X2 [Musca domestica]